MEKILYRKIIWNEVEKISGCQNVHMVLLELVESHANTTRIKGDWESAQENEQRCNSHQSFLIFTIRQLASLSK